MQNILRLTDETNNEKSSDNVFESIDNQGALTKSNPILTENLRHIEADDLGARGREDRQLLVQEGRTERRGQVHRHDHRLAGRNSY